MSKIDNQSVERSDEDRFESFAYGYEGCDRDYLLNLLYKDEEANLALRSMLRDLVKFLDLYRAALNAALNNGLAEPEDEPEVVQTTQFGWKLTPAEEAYMYQNIPHKFSVEIQEDLENYEARLGKQALIIKSLQEAKQELEEKKAQQRARSALGGQATSEPAQERDKLLDELAEKVYDNLPRAHKTNRFVLKELKENHPEIFVKQNGEKNTDDYMKALVNASMTRLRKKWARENK